MRLLLCKHPRNHRRSADCRSGGFTLVELVIVMLVISILTAAATPAFLDSLLFHRVEAAARRVKADLELARHTARLTSSQQTVGFTSSGYTLSAATKNLDNPSAGYVVNLRKDPYSVESVAANFGGTRIVHFDGFGTPNMSGTVTIVAKSHKCVVSLDVGTGEVTIVSDHTGGRSPLAVGN